MTTETILAPGEAVPEGCHVLDRPVAFGGTPAQAAENYATHWWMYLGDPENGDCRCGGCDAKPWHAAASYPCGENVPRERVVIERGAR